MLNNLISKRERERRRSNDVELETLIFDAQTLAKKATQKLKLTVAIPNIIQLSSTLGLDGSRSKGRCRCGEGEGGKGSLHGVG